MNQVGPCPYCGHIGYHIWAGGGGCPGAVPEGERDTTLENPFKADIKRLKALLARAADALDKEFGNPAYGFRGPVHDLIAELRKAAK